MVRRNRTVVLSPDKFVANFRGISSPVWTRINFATAKRQAVGNKFLSVRSGILGAGAERRGGYRDQCGHRCGLANRDQRRYVAAGLPTTGKGAGFGGTFIIPRHLIESVVAANHVDVNRAANLDAGVAARHSHKAGTEFRASLRLFCSSRFGGRQLRILRSRVWVGQGLCRRF